MLQRLPSEDQAVLKANGQLRQYSKGEPLQREGEVPSRQVMINSGYACIEILGRALEVVGPGTVFGSTMGVPVPNHATLRAISPVVAMSFDVRVLSEVWVRNPQMLLELVDFAVKRVQGYQSFLYSLSNPSVDIRLAAVLWHLGEPDPSTGFRKVPKCVTQTILASLLRVTREEVNKRIRILSVSQYLVMRGTEITMSPRTPVLIQSAE
jgi:CRP-like cAMP-binding protein